MNLVVVILIITSVLSTIGLIYFLVKSNRLLKKYDTLFKKHCDLLNQYKTIEYQNTVYKTERISLAKFLADKIDNHK